jgi:glycosyltransferase involved in cell wall biosynthesis
VEKNIAAFLALDLPGTKVVIGDGPQRAALQKRHPATRFLGTLHGQELAAAFADADAFVFPSRTDTFGLVLLEALACGVPVAAYPVTGPIDVVNDPRVAVLDEDLGRAAHAVLALSREACREFALGHGWSHTARQFVSNLALLSDVAVPAIAAQQA